MGSLWCCGKTSGLSINLLQCSFLNGKQVIKSYAEHKFPAMQGDNKRAGEVRVLDTGKHLIARDGKAITQPFPILQAGMQSSMAWSHSLQRSLSSFRFLGAVSPAAGGLEQQPGWGVHVLSTCLLLSPDFSETVCYFLRCFYFSFFPLQFLSVWSQFFIFFNLFLAKKN